MSQAWSCAEEAWGGRLLPGDKSFKVSSSTPATWERLRMFFRETVPATFKETHNVIEATTFVEYAPVVIRAQVYTDGDGCIVLLRHPPRKDVVRFAQMTDLIINFLQSFDQPDMPQGFGTCCSLSFDDGDFDDLQESWDVDDGEWGPRIDYFLALFQHEASSEREEAAQVLARWADTSSSLRLPLAEAVALRGLRLCAAGPGAQGARGSLPLHELYPLASAMKSVSLCSKAAAVLATSSMFDSIILMLQSNDTPSLVRRELEAAHSLISKVTSLHTDGMQPWGFRESIGCRQTSAASTALPEASGERQLSYASTFVRRESLEARLEDNDGELGDD